MPRIDPETVNKILDTADIVDVVSDFVKLRRSGANYKGLCPFHNERTPSFSVNRARNICKCFSCGKGGSPVNFIMEHEQLSYQEALRYLARKYNIEIVEKELTDEERAAQNTREAMLAVNEFALSHFEKNLLSTSEGRDLALAYLRRIQGKIPCGNGACGGKRPRRAAFGVRSFPRPCDISNPQHIWPRDSLRWPHNALRQEHCQVCQFA